jgi:hypothetical protein
VVHQFEAYFQGLGSSVHHQLNFEFQFLVTSMSFYNFSIFGQIHVSLHAGTSVMIFNVCRVSSETWRCMWRFLSACMRHACNFIVLLFLAGGAIVLAR